MKKSSSIKKKSSAAKKKTAKKSSTAKKSTTANNNTSSFASPYSAISTSSFTKALSGSAPGKMAENAVQASSDNARKIGKQVVENITKISNDVSASRKKYQDAVNSTKQQSKKVSGTMLKNYDQANNYVRDNFNALAKSNEIWSKAAESIGKSVSDYAQKSFDESMSAVTAAMGCKSLPELTELNNSLTQKSISEIKSESTKWSEQTAKAAKEATQPIQDRFNQTIEKISNLS
ncbi:MAG: phasin family protein [Alphaproteobacteria bacterium]